MLLFTFHLRFVRISIVFALFFVSFVILARFTAQFHSLYQMSTEPSDIRILTQSENDPTDRGFIMTSDLMKDILSSELIQKELEQEQQDIVLLRDNFPNAQIIHQLRSGSQKLGQYFAEQIKNVQSKLN